VTENGGGRLGLFQRKGWFEKERPEMKKKGQKRVVLEEHASLTGWRTGRGERADFLLRCGLREKIRACREAERRAVGEKHF